MKPSVYILEDRDELWGPIRKWLPEERVRYPVNGDTQLVVTQNIYKKGLVLDPNVNDPEWMHWYGPSRLYLRKDSPGNVFDTISIPGYVRFDDISFETDDPRDLPKYVEEPRWFEPVVEYCLSKNHRRSRKWVRTFTTFFFLTKKKWLRNFPVITIGLPLLSTIQIPLALPKSCV